MGYRAADEQHQIGGEQMTGSEVMCLDPVVDIFETDTALVITRRGAGVYTNGLFVAAEPSTLNIQAAVQPATSKDLLSLEEGQRTKETKAIYSKTELRTADEGTGVQADIVTKDSEYYEVQFVRPWFEVAGFYKALAVRIDLA